MPLVFVLGPAVYFLLTAPPGGQRIGPKPEGPGAFFPSLPVQGGQGRSSLLGRGLPCLDKKSLDKGWGVLYG